MNRTLGMPKMRSADLEDPTVQYADKRPDTAVAKTQEVGKTAGGKTLLIVTDQNLRTFSVKFKEGGELPESLSGKYTRRANAQHAIELYLLTADAG